MAFLSRVASGEVPCDIEVQDAYVSDLSLTHMELDVLLLVQNEAPFGITLKEVSFEITFPVGERIQFLGKGKMGEQSIPADGSISFTVPVVVENMAILMVLAEFFRTRGASITIKGTAVVDMKLTNLKIPFERTITSDHILESLQKE